MHKHPNRIARVRLDSPGASDYFPLQIRERLDAELLDLVCVPDISELIIDQPSSKLATILEADVEGDRVSSVGTSPFDRSDLELHRDSFLRHLLDGFFGGQHLLLLLASPAVRLGLLSAVAARFRLLRHERLVIGLN